MHNKKDYSFTFVLNEIEEEFSEANQQHCTHMLLSAYSLLHTHTHTHTFVMEEYNHVFPLQKVMPNLLMKFMSSQQHWQVS